jgi:dimethylamine/trimethylamine dehydrogenase
MTELAICAATRAQDRFDVLFEKVRIGPVETSNRFYQVPHCNGMNRLHPSAMANMRGVKAEGGWGVVCTEQCDVHYSGCHPRELRLWDERDIPILARMAEEVHKHGALAGIELAHNGSYVTNLETRTIPIAPSCVPTRGVAPVTARQMDKADIAAARRWHVTAARNAKKAGFNIIYIYAGHDMTLPAHFLSRRHNRRIDEYGGSLENRVRFLRELLEETKAAVGDQCGIALRFGVDEMKGAAGLSCEGEGRDVVEILKDLPDLWDVNLSDFNNDGQTSRFSEEGFQESYIRFVKTVTDKPVVGVGRFTSPDLMVSMINRGVLDLIGAARPSIADPFLPTKIRNREFDDIRECIGCNMCVASDKLSVPLRCTQNPTIGDEWRRGWHPEKIAPKNTNDEFLIVGGGPAGLEAATWLGKRGYPVMLADREDNFGGRVLRESALPGLAAWRRVADWRLSQLRKSRHVQLLPRNPIDADIALSTDATVIAVATGAIWISNGTGRTHHEPIPGLDRVAVYTPDDIMLGRLPKGRVLIFDDEHYYMGGVIAELLASKGSEVLFCTPESLVSPFTANTAEQGRVQRRVMECSREVFVSTRLAAIADRGAQLTCMYTGRSRFVDVDAVVLVTGQVPNDQLYHDLIIAAQDHEQPPRIVRLGDCFAPGSIAAAVYSGHAFARTLDTDMPDRPPFRRENSELDWDQAFPTKEDVSHGCG